MIVNRNLKDDKIIVEYTFSQIEKEILRRVIENGHIKDRTGFSRDEIYPLIANKFLRVILTQGLNNRNYSLSKLGEVYKNNPDRGERFVVEYEITSLEDKILKFTFKNKKVKENSGFSEKELEVLKQKNMLYLVQRFTGNEYELTTSGRFYINEINKIKNILKKGGEKNDYHL